MTYIYDAPIAYDTPQPYDFIASWGGAGNPPPSFPHLNAAMVLGNDGTFLTWQQGTIDEVAQSVEVICGTMIGDRTVVPTFGLPPIVFNTQPGQTQQQVVQAINTWEPRAQVQVVITPNGEGSDPLISVNTSLRKGSTI